MKNASRFLSIHSARCKSNTGTSLATKSIKQSNNGIGNLTMPAALSLIFARAGYRLNTDLQPAAVQLIHRALGWRFLLLIV